ncbi:hypothetical protein H8959_021245 [Pygathrix nigripes]
MSILGFSPFFEHGICQTHPCLTDLILFQAGTLFSLEHMIQKNQCLFTNTQCKVCCALLISESQKLAHYQVCHHTFRAAFLFRPDAKPLILPGLHGEV